MISFRQADLLDSIRMQDFKAGMQVLVRPSSFGQPTSAGHVVWTRHPYIGTFKDRYDINDYETKIINNEIWLTPIAIKKADILQKLDPTLYYIFSEQFKGVDKYAGSTIRKYIPDPKSNLYKAIMESLPPLHIAIRTTKHGRIISNYLPGDFEKLEKILNKNGIELEFVNYEDLEAGVGADKIIFKIFRKPLRKADLLPKISVEAVMLMIVHPNKIDFAFLKASPSEYVNAIIKYIEGIIDDKGLIMHNLYHYELQTHDLVGQQSKYIAAELRDIIKNDLNIDYIQNTDNQYQFNFTQTALDKLIK